MELKDYRQTVITDLENFLEYLDRYEFVGFAFQMFWQDKGLTIDASNTTSKTCRMPASKSRRRAGNLHRG